MEQEIVLEAKALTKRFTLSSRQMKERKLLSNSLMAVDGLSFNLKKGSIYALLGPNGAGKTTTLRMVATLLSPTSGEILYRGKDIHQDVSDYRKKVGFLTSELKLDDFFTPDYTFDYMAALYGLSKEETAKRKKEVFERFGVTPFALTSIKNLSTGMKQKVSLAISIAHDPEIIIYDEPTNGLDILASRDVEDFLAALREEGKAIVISTHIFSLVEKLADEIGIILNGKMALEGNMKDVTKDKNLETVFFDLIGGVKQ
ncbi:MAG: ABC transporter ATP-binding protein [Bacilli bacterium]|nr:ABC transporter ATP-binding protein [Bacilli bacterium]